MSRQTGILIDLEGFEISPSEQKLLLHPYCTGIILFSRNYQNLQQLRSLTTHIRQLKPQALIAVDHEGGRVQRFRDGFSLLPPMKYWGELFDKNRQLCCQQLSQTIHKVCTELREAGINLNLIPVLDLNHEVSAVIGERSLHSKPEVVSELGRLIIQEMHKQKFPAVGKHFPGHGAVVLDSHLNLPIDNRDWTTLWHGDMKPFVDLIHQLDMIMPAHIVYSAMDSRPIGFSPFWLKEVLRYKLGFKGLIISDDLSMGAAATRGGYTARAREAFLAGCDLLLVCNNRSGAEEALEALYF